MRSLNGYDGSECSMTGRENVEASAGDLEGQPGGCGKELTEDEGEVNQSTAISWKHVENDEERSFTAERIPNGNESRKDEMRREALESGTLSWTSNNYTELQKTRFLEVIRAIDKASVIQACKEKRGVTEIGCTIPNRWSMGSRNLVFELYFDDGLRWVVKIWMLSLSSPCGAHNGRRQGADLENPKDSRSDGLGSSASKNSDDEDDPYQIFQDEFDAMCFFRTHTNIPVPAPHLILRLSTRLGETACLVMDFVGGLHGSDFFDIGLLDRPLEIQQRMQHIQERIMWSMAEVQIKLAQFQSSVGGSLARCQRSDRRWPVVGEYGVVEDCAHRACRTTMAYYKHALDKRKEDLDCCLNLDTYDATKQILDIFEANYARLCSKSAIFYLTNVDLGGHNAIFDCDGNLKAIIDIDVLRFVPIEVAVQLPAQFGLSYCPIGGPSVWLTGHEKGPLAVVHYADIVRHAAIELGLSELGDFFANHITAESSILVSGLYIADEGYLADCENWLASDKISRFMTGKLSLPIKKQSSFHLSKLRAKAVSGNPKLGIEKGAVCVRNSVIKSDPRDQPKWPRHSILERPVRTSDLSTNEFYILKVPSDPTTLQRDAQSLIASTPLVRDYLKWWLLVYICFFNYLARLSKISVRVTHF